jgi:hypothetical protein
MQYEYEWDHNKARSNLRKHGIHFADAVAVFNDPFAIMLRDESPEEERFIIIGLDFLRRILVVVYTERGKKTIRIISARKATKFERQQYEE